MSEDGSKFAPWDGSCHCGAVRVTLAHAPIESTQCNCGLCAKSGFRGVYAPADDVTVTGELSSYVRSDIDEPMIKMWRCAHCGIATHWTPLASPPHQRIGINARLFEPALVAALPVNNVDGASW